MGNGFGSIEDLLGQKNATSSTGNSGANNLSKPAYGSASQKFQDKMKQVALKEKEVDVQRKAAQIRVPYISLERFPISHEALRQLPEARAKELGVVCFFSSGDEIRIGAINPSDEAVKELLHQLTERTGANGSIYMISQLSFNRVLALYKTLPNVAPVSKDVTVKAEDLDKVKEAVKDFASFGKLLKEQSTTDIVTFVMGAGLKLDASDVHIEAEENRVMVRFRLDGILHDAAEIPRDAYKQLISRLKLLSSLKINISDKPQDGRFTVKLPTGDVDIRVSTIPTVYGESVVMRLLIQKQQQYSLESLGLRGQQLERLQREIKRPNGMIVTTGPTGSGKTTTLYAIMQILNQSDVKIITLEDPVEYKMEGINQSQIDKSHDYTFAKGLKSMLRQDPDIAMVGEIRDLETAEIAVQASLTGHLMLSTVHTNDAFGAIPRFLSMGVQPFLLAPALNCVIGQRLVRRLNNDLKVPATLTPEIKERVDKIIESLPADIKAEVMGKDIQFYTAPPEEALGYKGRLGIYEVFVVDNDIEGAITSGKVSEYEIRKIATQNGTITMAQDGILKAIDGLTSVEEVFRVIE